MSPLLGGMKLAVGIFDTLALLYNEESIHQSAERNEQPGDRLVKASKKQEGNSTLFGKHQHN